MRILYLSGATFPSEVSHTLSIMRMCQAFADAGHDVLLSGLASSDITENPITYYGLKGGFRLELKEAGKRNAILAKLGTLLQSVSMGMHDRQIMKRFEPQIVYSRLTVLQLLFVPRRIPIVFEMHSLGPLGRQGLKGRILSYSLKAKRIRRIIVTTNALRELLLQITPDADVVVARLSAESPVPITEQGVERFKQENLLGRSLHFHVGYTGYLDTTGLRGTEIICRLATSLPDTAFHVVGGKPDIAEYWRKYAESLGHHNNIFFYGHRNPAEIPFFLHCFNIALAPLQYRPSGRAPMGAGMSPLKIPQYMAYRKTIVASDIPAHRELLEHDRTAILVPCDGASKWKEAIVRLRNDQTKCLRLGEEAFRVYNEGFRPEVRVLKILQGLHEK